MTDENTREELEQVIEAKREEVKDRFGLDDEQFNLLIRNVILDSFDKLRVRLSADDPIFSVILAQKSVMDYYSVMITNSLNQLPKQIGYSIDDKLEELSESVQGLGVALDNEISQFKKDFNTQALDLNNQIITSFNTFIDSKITSIKEALDSVKTGTPDLPRSIEPPKEDKSIFNALILLFTLINITVAGLTLYTVHNDKGEREEAYQMGLFKGFEQVKKTLPTKDADKVQTIIIEAIDNELKAR